MREITIEDVRRFVATPDEDGKIKSLKQVIFPERRRDYCAFAMAVEERVSSPSYVGLDHVYIGWKNPSGELEHRVLASSINRDDFLDLLEVSEEGPDIVVKYDRGDYETYHDIEEARVPKSELGLT